jgi:uncharacterized protein YdeI (YjbR/CyaY-like superfamily)
MEQHHATVDAVWVGYYRAGVDKASIGYVDSVEVGLAFGWIDGITYRVDDEVRAIRFTPRRKGSNWSAANVERMQRIIAAGEAHPAGLAAFEARTASRTGVYSYETAPRELPAAYEAPLRASEAAWQFWQAQAPSYRRVATHWVLSAKRQATRDRRLATLVEDCAAGRWIRPAAYGRARDRRP